MTSPEFLIIKMVSHLLQYPDQEVRDSLESLAPLIAELPPGRSREILDGFTRHCQNIPLIRWQEEYSRHFDLSPAASLNLTYHQYGDTRERGPALIRLHQVYRQAGYEAVGELPDYLPLVLEFLAVCPVAERLRLIQEFWPQLEALAGQLQKTGTGYAGLLSVILDILGRDRRGGG